MKASLSVLFMLFLLHSNHTRSQVPQLNSYAAAQATIYLDFDGQNVTGTSWNWNGPINAEPAALSTAAIIEIFNRVAEDFRIFNLNITTDSSVFLAAPLAMRTRIIITPTSSWYGRAGGVSFIGSFTWGDDTPAWVFSELLGNKIKYVAEACSHEAGHTLGLQHQSSYNVSCSKTAEYSAGQGSGEIGWAPIMGVGYYKNLTTWYTGTSAISCNSLQNDIDIIASGNGFGLRPDDFGDTPDSAGNLVINGSGFDAKGIINSATDRDLFKITLGADLNFRLTAIPQNVGNANSGADVDIRVTLLNDKADTIGRYNPSDLLNAGVDTNLNAGTYYLMAEGVGNVNLSDYGSVGYYALSGTLNSPLPIHNLNLKGYANNNIHLLSWTYQADEPIKEFEVQFSYNGAFFQKLMTAAPSKTTTSYHATSSQKTYYRIKAITLADEMAYYSNIIALQSLQKEEPVEVLNRAGTSLQIRSSGNYEYQLLQPNGQVMRSGKIYKGVNTIPTSGNANGLLLLRVINANESWTRKIIQQ